MQFENLKSSTKLYILLAVIITPIAVLSVQGGVAGETVQTFTSGNIDSNPLNVITGQAAAMQDVETTAVDSIDLQKGLSGYWRFDNPKTSRGYSLEFNTSGEKVEISSFQGPTQVFTGSYWVKTTQVSGANSMMGYGGSNDIIFYTPSSLTLYVNNTAHDFGVNISDGSWHHIVWQWRSSDGQAKLYVDGVQKGSTNLSQGATLPSTSCWVIGREQDSNCGGYSSGQDFHGEIDDVRIYERYLSSSEVKNLYSDRAVSDKSLILHHDFDEGPKNCDVTPGDPCLTDDSGNGYSGVPGNFNDNNLATGSGWLQKTPVNRPSVKDYSGGNLPGNFYGGNNGDLQNFNFDSVSGWRGGKVGKYSLKFDGLDDIVTNGSSQFDITDSVTLAAWVKPVGSVEDAVIYRFSCGNGGGYRLKTQESYIQFSFNNGTYDYHLNSDSVSSFVGEWTHQVATYSDRKDEIRFYINGQSAGTVETNAKIESLPGAPFAVGKGGCGSDYFNGSIDDVRVYRKALSEDDVEDLYRGKNVGKNLISRWNFESGDRKTAYDTSNLKQKGLLDTNSVRSNGLFNLTTSTGYSASSEGRVSVSAWYRSNEYKFGDGSDGSLTISNTVKIDEGLMSNGRSYPDGVNYVVKDISGSELETFSNPSGIKRGDQVIVINMQGTPSSYSNVGKYSFKTVESVNLSRNKIYLKDIISQDYGNPKYQNVVVQRIPEYTSVNVDGGKLTTSAWSEAELETCPNGWKHHDGECYSQVGSDTWSNVRSQCRNYGGELARIDNSTVNSFIANNYPDSWIGFRDISGSNDGGSDGSYEWVWTFGDYYSYKNFSSNEPSIGGVNNNPVTRIGSKGGRYTEFGSNNTYPGVCELNKKKGGILAFRASEQIDTRNGRISATGKGYTGGDCSFCGDDSDGRAGEGIAGTGKYGFYSENANVNGGAGSYANNNNGGDPAGGGGYGTDGGTSDNGQEGGQAVGNPVLKRIYFGGGGGAGSDNDGGSPASEDSHGGGIIYTVSERARGLNVSNRGIESFAGPGCHGASGGGAGGTIYLKSRDAEIAYLNASGGPRDYSGNCGQEWSGEGGDGRVRINTIDKRSQTVYPQPYDTGFIPNLVRKGNNFGVGGYADIVFGNIKNESAAVSGLSGSSWRNVVLTFDGSTGKIYLDGELGSSFTGGNIASSRQSLAIGPKLEGKIDEVRLYNRSLSQKEVQRLAFQ